MHYFEVRFDPYASGWIRQFFDANRNLLADSATHFGSEAKARAAAELVKANAGGAEIRTPPTPRNLDTRPQQDRPGRTGSP